MSTDMPFKSSGRISNEEALFETVTHPDPRVRQYGRLLAALDGGLERWMSAELADGQDVDLVIDNIMNLMAGAVATLAITTSPASKAETTADLVERWTERVTEIINDHWEEDHAASS